MSSHKVLLALDSAKTQWYHFTTILIAGMGFFTDAYDLFCVSTVTRLLGRLYYYDPTTGKPGTLPANVSAAVNSVALCGTFAGQLFFGWLGDKLGRKKVYGFTLLLMIIASIGSGVSFGLTAKSVMATLCFFRFWLGFGIGGDYPLSATIMSEYANKCTRGAFIAAVFAMQGIGIITAATVSIVLSSIFRHAYPRPAFNVDAISSTPPQADFVWRILFSLGAIPAALTFYYRMKMPETARYTALVEGNFRQAAMDMARVMETRFDGGVDDEETSELDAKSVENFKRQLTSRRPYGLWSREFLLRHGGQLFGCCCTWFLLDVAFYSQNLFQKDVFSSVRWLPSARKMSAMEEVFRISKAQALVALASTVPGYWATVISIEYLGRRFIQLMGFLMMTIFMLIITVAYDTLRGEACSDGTGNLCGGNRRAFLILYSLTFFFANFGPNATTFIIPAELFPARLRSTCHGISAATGKAGAIVGAFGFLYASQSRHHPDVGFPPGIGLKNALLLLTVTNAAGFVCTLIFVPETRAKSLEELSGEREESTANESGILPDDLYLPHITPVVVPTQRRPHDGQYM